MTSHLNSNRRRKKKVNYGVRAVELCRGKNGFGFTISGQSPCLLSSIVVDSPAERAGLKPGNCLIAVNGENVASASHDEVVRRIGSTVRFLKLQIAENYHSESSEDEFLQHRPKSKYPNRVKLKQNTYRAENVVADLRSGALFSEHVYKNQKIATNRGEGKPIKPPCRSNGAVLDIITSNHDKSNASIISRMEKLRDQKENVCSKQMHKKIDKCDIKKYEKHPAGQDLSKPLFTHKDLSEILYPTSLNVSFNNYHDKTPIIRSAVGYLGSIEMPSENYLKTSRLQAIRNCIKRIRVEKKVHTLMFMQVFEDVVILTNILGTNIAVYPAQKIIFCGVYADDTRFFGIVTMNNSGDQTEAIVHKITGSSCHVFMVDTKLQPHRIHTQYTHSFNFQCTYNPDTGNCYEFPSSAGPLLLAIGKLYKGRPALSIDPAPGLINIDSQPPPSSNNSDSGIGFSREDDRCIDGDKFVDKTTICDNPTCNSCSQKLSGPNPKVNRLTVRAMPDPVKLHGVNSICNSDSLADFNNATNLRSSVYKLYNQNSSHEYSGQSSTDSCCDPCLTLPVFCKSNGQERKYGNDNHLSMKAIPGNKFRTELCIDLEKLQCPNKKQDSLIWGPNGNYISHIRSSSHSELNESLLAQNGSDFSDVEKGQDTLKRVIRNGSFRRNNQNTRKFLQKESKATGTFYRETPSPLSLRHASSLNSLDQIACSSQEFLETSNRVATWAVSFDKLLHDPVGLQAFREFLKVEFSEENIMFWIACDQFQMLTNLAQMKIKAREIYDKHLASSACDPVNVDSQARQNAKEGLDNPNPCIFQLAQKQISLLMKFDSYSRFLKSNIYKDCLKAELSGHSLPYQADDSSGDGSSQENDKKKVISSKETFEDLDDKRRKSLLPWNRVKVGKSISKNEEFDSRRSQRSTDRQEVANDLGGSRASLASGDLVLMQKDAMSKESLNGDSSATCKGVCRVIMPNSATTVIPTKTGETIRSLLQKLCEKRGLNFSAVDVFYLGSDEVIDQNLDSSVLGCKEILMERRVLFRLDLPNRKTIGVKAKPNKNLVDVLNPILHKYGYVLNDMIVHMIGAVIPLNLHQSTVYVDNQHLWVQFKEDFAQWGCGSQRQYSSPISSGVQLRKARKSNSLEAITNKVFEEVFSGKGDGATLFDELGVLDLDKAKTEDPNFSAQHRTSSIFNMKKQNSGEETGVVVYKSKGKGKVSFIKKDLLQLPAAERKIAETKTKQENERLFQLLSRAQKQCLDDQRGTVTNFELPDFLKIQPTGKSEYMPGHHPLKYRNSEPFRTPTNNNEIIGRSSDSVVTMCKHPQGISPSESFKQANWGIQLDGVTPSHLQAEEYFCSASKITSPDFNNSQLMEKDLQDIGMEPVTKPILGFSDHLINWVSEASPNTTVVENPDHTLTLENSFNLPSPPNELEQTLIVDEPSFSPPTPLDKSLQNNSSRLVVIPFMLDDDIPPPLPPKTKSRYMQQNHPTRHLVSGNPNLCNSLEGENAQANNVLHTNKTTELSNQEVRSRQTLYVGQGNDSWQISLV